MRVQGNRENLPSSSWDTVSELCCSKVLSPGENTCYEEVSSHISQWLPSPLPARVTGGSFTRLGSKSFSLSSQSTQPAAICQSYHLSLDCLRLLLQVSRSWLLYLCGGTYFYRFRVVICPITSLLRWAQAKWMNFPLVYVFLVVRMGVTTFKFFTHQSLN